jgi:signal transduction histidine kinase
VSRENIDLESAKTLLGLVAGIAHELATPIGTGVTAASTIQSKAREIEHLYRNNKIKRSDLEDFFYTIEEGTRILLSSMNKAALLNNSFKHMAVDAASEAITTVNLKGYIEEVLVCLGPQLKRTKHQIQGLGDKRLRLLTYPGYLFEIFTNLILNSLVHAFAGENTGGNIVIKFEHSGDTVSITYSDNGSGIAPENINRIFDQFFTTKREEGGSGLGLFIVHERVTQKLKGTIEVKSEIGKGTEFNICLPNEPGL